MNRIALWLVAVLVIQSQETEPRVFRNASADWYHESSCSIYRSSKGQQEVSLSAALAAGLSACPVCKVQNRPDVAAHLAKKLIAETESRKARELAEEARELGEKTRPLSPIITQANAQQMAARVLEGLKTEGKITNILAGVANTGFRMGFRLEVKRVAPDYAGDPIDIVANDDLSVQLTSPLMRYEFAVSESVRKMTPSPVAPWSPTVVIVVSPKTINSPDVERVAVLVDGTAVPPVASDLVLQTMETRFGATRSIHAGRVAFPLSAFRTITGTITVVLIPQSGDNLTKTLTLREIRQIQ